MKMIDTIINIETPKLPPDVEFIENEIKKAGIDPIRWAIIEIEQNTLSVSVAGILI